MGDHDEIEFERTSRRTFMSRAIVAMGGVIGLVTAIPLVRYFWHPVGRKVVKSSDEPIDVGAANALPKDGTPVKMQVVADDVRDAWSVSDEVALGAVWLREAEGKVQCFSGVCPHLGCAIDFDDDKGAYECPCHESAFAVDGEKLAGPSKRGLDPLPVEKKDGRLLVRWKRFKVDVPEREEV